MARNANVRQAEDGCRCIFSVQDRKYEMTGDRGLDRYLGGLQVAKLAA